MSQLWRLFWQLPGPIPFIVLVLIAMWAVLLGIEILAGPKPTNFDKAATRASEGVIEYVSMAFWPVLIGYVALHFIVKYW
jgi:hypothetical protein